MPYSNLTFNISLNKEFNTNDFVKVAHDGNNYITGRVVSYSPSTGVLVVEPYEVVGSGTYSSWNVTLTGFNGSAGTSGSSGTSGTTGTSGSTGTSGTAGTAASTGTSGSSATSGSSGDAGSSATSGDSGSSGTSASSGTVGTAGTAGTDGSSASSGTNGTSGSTGSSGTSGGIGTSGSSGNSGSTGNSGASGGSGTSGSNGATGPQGPIGPQGPTGAQGGKGASGVNGGTGPQGGTGPTGAPGGTGAAGAPGPQGPTGPGGPQGPAGGQGGQGPTGTSASYNQGLYTYSYPTFGNVATPANIYTSNFMKHPAYQGLYSSANQGVPWLGRSDAWWTNGALGAAGFFNTSSRSAKENIQPFSPSAVEILNEVDIVSYNYEVEQNDEDTRIGFIAEDTPTILSGNDHDRMDTVSVIGLVMKSVQEIDKRITNLENKKNNAI
jgi:hypothetical protein